MLSYLGDIAKLSTYTLGQWRSMETWTLKN